MKKYECYSTDFILKGMEVLHKLYGKATFYASHKEPNGDIHKYCYIKQDIRHSLPILVKREDLRCITKRDRFWLRLGITPKFEKSYGR